MSEETPLDLAHAAMEAAPEDDAARLRFYERLSDSELFLLLTKDVENDQVDPEVFDLGDVRFVLVFDREERLSQFVGKPAPYIALSGRVISQMLAGQGIGLGVNLEVAPSQMLIPPEAVVWLNDTLAHSPDEVNERAQELYAPKGLPEELLTAIDAKLASAVGLAQNAYLVAVKYEGGGKGHLLGFVGTQEGAESALAKAAGEALTFSGIEAGSIDVGFFDANDPMAAAMAKVGLRFVLPKQTARTETIRPAPGSDPDNPPLLK
ncbi:SseB family protein [Planktotalea sp.]|uniref:SseB family protein n=1 Tax=Planktotalea sp. TaxID=2029877 RepID=UPI00329A12EF